MAVDNYRVLHDYVEANYPLWSSELDDNVILTWLLANADTPNREAIDYNTLAVWASEENIAFKLTNALRQHYDTLRVTPEYSDHDVGNAMTNSDVGGCELLLLILGAGEGIEMTRSDVRTIVSSISGAGKPLSAANNNALKQKSDVDWPRWQEAGWQVAPQLPDVTRARTSTP